LQTARFSCIVDVANEISDVQHQVEGHEVILSLVVVLLLVVAVAALTRFAPKPDVVTGSYGSDVSFLESFSLQTYRPMLRLATQMDRRYLTAAHGDSLAGCYRKIQRGLLREYLRDAAKDFNRLYAIANAKSLRAASDPGDLSMALFEQQMTFIMLVWGIEARLLLDRVVPFGVNLSPLINSIEGLAAQTRELARPQFGYQAV